MAIAIRPDGVAALIQDIENRVKKAEQAIRRAQRQLDEAEKARERALGELETAKAVAAAYESVPRPSDEIGTATAPVQQATPAIPPVLAPSVELDELEDMAMAYLRERTGRSVKLEAIFKGLGFDPTTDAGIALLRNLSKRLVRREQRDKSLNRPKKGWYRYMEDLPDEAEMTTAAEAEEGFDLGSTRQGADT